MRDLWVLWRRGNLIPAALALAIPLTACGDVGEHNAAYSTPAGWQSVCLNRLLIDLPSDVDMGAGSVSYRGGFSFPEIKYIGAAGVWWSGVTVKETYATDASGYDKVRGGANGELTGALLDYKAGNEGAERSNGIYRRDLQTGTTGEKAFAKKMIEENRQTVAKNQRGFKVSGKAKLPEKYAFAIRRSDEYSVGYFDADDQRVRMFEGALSNQEPLSPEAAANEYRHFKSIYHRRAPTDIPMAPGFCTGYGFIDEPTGPAAGRTELDLPFRSLKYPNLVFTLTVEPASAHGPRDIRQLDNPNAITMKELKEMKGAEVLAALSNLGDIKKAYGPKPAIIAGQAGRIFGREYHNEGHMSPHGGGIGAAYEIEADALGEPGRPDRPAIKLVMAAALPDADNPDPDVEAYRPALKGHQPPPFEEGLKIFEQVVKSIRLRPGAIAPQAAATAASASPGLPASKQ